MAVDPLQVRAFGGRYNACTVLDYSVFGLRCLYLVTAFTSIFAEAPWPLVTFLAVQAVLFELISQMVSKIRKDASLPLADREEVTTNMV